MTNLIQNVQNSSINQGGDDISDASSLVEERKGEEITYLDPEMDDFMIGQTRERGDTLTRDYESGDMNKIFEQT